MRAASVIKWNDESAIAAESIARRRYSSSIAWVEACLARIDELEPQVRAWVVVDRDGALKQAAALDAERAAGNDRGALHGVPIAVKDIIDVAGLPTACGSRRWRDRVAAADSPLVARLRAAGAVILGKTVTTPYAWIDPPPTRNPWDLDRTPGGSSSGSAAALACGMAAAALGSQTGGSITRPASFCGVCGLKPTFGILPLEGVLPFAPSLDHPGPMARSIADLIILWNVLIGPGACEMDRPPDANSPIRLGRLRGLFDARAEPAMRAALDGALIQLEQAGMTIVEAAHPPDFDNVAIDHRTIMAAEAAHVHADWLKAHPDDYPPRIRSLIVEGLAVKAAAYLRARERQAAMRRACEALFDGADALVTPAAIGPAPGPETTGDPVMSAPWSFTGLPTVTFPMRLAPDGLPLGIQLIGKPSGERALLEIARRCEAVIHRANEPMAGRRET